MVYATFHSLNRLHHLDLSFNAIISAQVFVLDMFTIQEHYLFDLSHNNLTLSDVVLGTLQNIRGTLRLSYNSLITLPDGTLTSLEMIQGNLDLSHNGITSLPKGIFSSLEQVWSPYEERATLDLRRNHLEKLPDGMFISLWFIYLTEQSI